MKVPPWNKISKYRTLAWWLATNASFENKTSIIHSFSEIESKYNALRAGGGDSSSHTISSSNWPTLQSSS